MGVRATPSKNPNVVGLALNEIFKSFGCCWLISKFRSSLFALLFLSVCVFVCVCTWPKVGE